MDHAASAIFAPALVTLVCTDGRNVRVPLAAANLCGTLSGILENIGDVGAATSAAPLELCATAEQAQTLFDYVKALLQHPAEQALSPDDKIRTSVTLSDWERQWLWTALAMTPEAAAAVERGSANAQQDLAALQQYAARVQALAGIVDYLMVPRLGDVLAYAEAYTIERIVMGAQSLDESEARLRAVFCLADDMTPEERRTVRAQFEWAHIDKGAAEARLTATPWLAIREEAAA